MLTLPRILQSSTTENLRSCAVSGAMDRACFLVLAAFSAVHMIRGEASR